MRVAQRRPHGLQITVVIEIVALCSCCERVQAAIGLLSLFALLGAEWTTKATKNNACESPQGSHAYSLCRHFGSSLLEEARPYPLPA